MNEVDSFLGDLNETPQDPFVIEETKGEKPEVVEEEKLPFHKDPKVQRFIEREIEKRLADSVPQEAEKFTKEKETENPFADVLTRIIGNDTPEKLSAINDFQKAMAGMKEEAKMEALREIENSKEEEVKQEREALNELTQGFENIEETFGVDLTSEKSAKVRSDFVDFIKRVAPKDEDGQVTEFPDLEETWKLYQDTRKPNAQTSRAKELAARSMNKPGDASTTPEVAGKSWKDVDRIFSKLLG